MAAIKKLTSFSVCLQCVFDCTIGSGKLLKWNWPFAVLGSRLPLNVNPGQRGRGVSRGVALSGIRTGPNY